MMSLNTFELNTKKIVYNLNEFKRNNNNAKICAILKADAYGHGIEAVCNAIKNKVDFFGVADFSEAMSVRNNTYKPILVLEAVPFNAIDECIENNISLSVSNMVYLRKIAKHANMLNKKVKIHLAVNSGMNRLGFSNINVFKKTLNYINHLQNLILEGIYTHFYDATNSIITDKQYEKFCNYCNLIDDKSIIKHIASSNAALLSKKYHFDMVRLGILLYGYSDIKPSFKLQQAITLKSTIINIVKVNKGQNVGYGNNFVADKNMIIACVSIGYADGIMRSNSNNGKVIIVNKYAKIIGNVCMNLLMIDITNIKCRIGDEVIIIGETSNLKITAEDIAKRTNTISYEVLTNIKRSRMNYKVI